MTRFSERYLSCPSTLRALTSVLTAVLGLLSLPGCASNEIKWTEEVRLHDGTVVQVKRRVELGETGFPVQQRGMPKYFELCYPPLGAYWKSKPSYPPETFDIVEGKAYIKVPVRGCITCKLQGYPEADALYFQWDAGRWKKVEESDSLRKLRFNLLSAIYASNSDKADVRGLVTLTQKEQRDASAYGQMRLTGRTGPRDPGICAKCKGQRAGTTENAEVLLPSEARACNW